MATVWRTTGRDIGDSENVKRYCSQTNRKSPVSTRNNRKLCAHGLIFFSTKMRLTTAVETIVIISDRQLYNTVRGRMKIEKLAVICYCHNSSSTPLLHVSRTGAVPWANCVRWRHLYTGFFTSRWNNCKRMAEGLRIYLNLPVWMKYIHYLLYIPITKFRRRGRN